MHVDDARHRVAIGEADVVKEAAAQEGIGQLFSLFDVMTTSGPVPRDDRPVVSYT